MKTLTIKTTIRRMERNAANRLRNAFLDSSYQLERATDFWSKRDDSDCLAGERKFIGSDVICTPLRFTGKALLVYLVDTQNKTWFAWIHA